jgi:putative hydrolase of the HAD superfamily
VPVVLPERLADRLNSPLPRTPRAALFDLYGTLLVSNSGDRSADSRASIEPFSQAIAIAGGPTLDTQHATTASESFYRAIECYHERSRSNGVAFPEVDIVDVWKTVLSEISPDSTVPLDPSIVAVAYEVAANPVWPMPGARELVATLTAAEFPTGIVSNAQFYTPMLLRALFQASLEELGIPDQLIAFSYRTGRAKPDPILFERPLAYLRSAGIDSNEVVYIGNDMLNDVYAAAANRCMTILFAGDRRSLRLREDRVEIAGLRPDSIVADLSSLLPLLTPRSKGGA